MAASFSKETAGSNPPARLILFYKIINGLAQVPFKGVLVEAYKCTRTEGNTIMKFRQSGHTTSQSMDNCFSLKLVHGIGLLSLKLPRRVLRNIETETCMGSMACISMGSHFVTNQGFLSPNISCKLKLL